MSRSAKGWSAQLDDLCAFAGADVLVAHNAGFDMDVLRRACEATGDACPPYRYLCSLQVARKTYSLPSYRLPFVAAEAGFGAFSHHEASADALACAHIVIDAAARAGAADVAVPRRSGRRAGLAHRRSRQRARALRGRGARRGRLSDVGAPGHDGPMDLLTASLLAVACLAAGALAGWCAHVARAASTGARASANLLARVAAAEATATSLREQLDLRNDEYRDLIDRARADQVAHSERERREAAVLTALSPVRETLLTMQQKVADLERDRHAQFGSLAEQLRRAHESDEALRATTESLASALRSNTTRGVWGETQLRRVVEAAGLTRYVDFDLQTAISSDAGAGRPDMIIRLPGEKALAVDAKVPLDAYLEASAIPLTATGEEGARRKDLLQKHVRAVRAHVDALAKKAYWSGLSVEPRVRDLLRAERVAALRGARGGPDPARPCVRQARRAGLARQSVGGAQDRRLHMDPAGRVRRGAPAVRPRQPALRPPRAASPATPTTCGARSSAPSTPTTSSPGRSSRACW